MAYYRFQLQAGIALRAPVAGRVILLDDLGGASGLDITPNYGGRDLPTMPGRQKAFKFMEPFDAVTLTAPVDCNVGIFLSASDVSLGFTSGSAVSVSGGQLTIANDGTQRVPVDLAGGVVNVSATNVGVNNNNAAAVPVKNQALSTIVNFAAVTVNAAAQAVQLVSDATLRRLRIRNSHATATIAIGGAGVTLAGSPIQLGPGDMFIEEDAAGAVWYVVTDTAGATVQIQGLK
jgi:hypothetical protein